MVMAIFNCEMKSVDCKVVSHFSNSWIQKLDDVIMFYVHGSSAGPSMSTVERKRFVSPGVSAWAPSPRPNLYEQCDRGEGSCALTIFLLRQLLTTPIYLTMDNDDDMYVKVFHKLQSDVKCQGLVI